MDYSACPKDQTPLQVVTDLIPGLVLRGKYEIIEKLGAGGMGAVYKARHLAFDELRAIKFVGQHLLSDESALGRFKSEAVVARKLQHPNAVRVDDLDMSDDGHPFIVMEYVEGKNLRDIFFTEADLTTRRILTLARQACSALAAAHALGVVHRDIKPENLMVVTGPDGAETLKVADFGLAKVLDGFELSSDQALTQTGFLLGTPRYMSPEQAAGLEVDFRSDLYSLGVVLYEMFTGRLPFRSETPLQMLMHHQATPPEPPAALGVPPALASFLMKALAKPREERFKTAAEMEDALRLLSLMPLPEYVGQGIREGFDPKWAGSRHASGATTVPARPGKSDSTVQLAGGSGRAQGSAPSRSSARRTSDGTTRLGSARPSSPRFVVRETEDAPSESSSSRFWIGLGVVAVVVVGLVMNRPRPASVPAPAPLTAPASQAAPQGAVPARPASVPAAAENNDFSIRFDVEHLLAGSQALSGANIQVDVTNGIVTLSGQVKDETSAELATSLAATVPGVRRAFSTLQAQGPAHEEANGPNSGATGAAPSAPPTAGPPTAPSEPRAEDATLQQVRALMEQARQKLQSSNPEAAEADLQAALKLDPNNAMIQDALRRLKNRPGPPPRPRPTR